MKARLLASIEALAIDPPGAPATFVDRLATQNGWTRSRAAAVDREYRRFLYLAATGDAPVTPSDAVDQAWHLHLSYTRSYWNDLCATVLGRPLHHGPTEGGPDEALRYRRQYQATLDRYVEVFGAAPPVSIWPPSSERFDGSFVRADRRRSWIIPHRTGALAALPVIGLASAAAADGGGPGSNLIIVAVIAVIALAWPKSPRRRRRRGGAEGDGGCSSDGGDGPDAGDGGGCGGGCGGGGD